MRSSLTLSNGRDRPATSTDVPAISLGAGSVEEESLPPARPLPRIEIRLPGATGVCGARPAELTTAAGVITGKLWLTRRPPVTEAVPRVLWSGSSAFTVMVTCGFFALRACHVPVQVPACEGVRLSGGSPFENVAATDPFVMSAPQS